VLAISDALKNPAVRQGTEELGKLLAVDESTPGAKALIEMLTGQYPGTRETALKVLKMLGSAQDSKLASSILLNFKSPGAIQMFMSGLEPSEEPANRKLSAILTSMLSSDKPGEQRAISNLLYLKLLDENEYRRFQTLLLSSRKEADAVMMLSKLENAEQCATMMKILHEPSFGQAGTVIMDMLRAGDRQAATALKTLTFLQAPAPGRPGYFDTQSEWGLKQGPGRELITKLGNPDTSDLTKEGILAFGQSNNIRLLAELAQSNSLSDIRKLIDMLGDKETREQAGLMIAQVKSELIHPMLSVLENPDMKKFHKLLFYLLELPDPDTAYSLISNLAAGTSEGLKEAERTLRERAPISFNNRQ
jgi:hypothetical protein